MTVFKTNVTDKPSKGEQGYTHPPNIFCVHLCVFKCESINFMKMYL